MALLCPVGVMAPHEQCRAPAEYCREATCNEITECEDESSAEQEELHQPLLAEGSPRAAAVIDEEHERAVSAARTLMAEKLQLLRGQRELSRTETSELLRDTCQALGDLATRLEEAWLQQRPGQPMPAWPLVAVPEDELGRIGWDFHANRVQIRQGRSVWESLGLLLSGDQQGGFAQPPSAGAVAEALSRTAKRWTEDADASGV